MKIIIIKIGSEGWPSNHFQNSKEIQGDIYEILLCCKEIPPELTNLLINNFLNIKLKAKFLILIRCGLPLQGAWGWMLLGWFLLIEMSMVLLK